MPLSGVIYTARDAAHKRMKESLDAHQLPPFDLKDQIIYYVGPTQTPPGMIFGSGADDGDAHGRLYARIAGSGSAA